MLLLPMTTRTGIYCAASQVPRLIWVCLVIITFGVSFQMLQGLQGPLASLNAASHVRCRLARVRLMSNGFMFAETPAETSLWRELFREELETMRQEYSALLYGGVVPHVVRFCYVVTGMPYVTHRDMQPCQCCMSTALTLPHIATSTNL
jgi:hypothetical protein